MKRGAPIRRGSYAWSLDVAEKLARGGAHLPEIHKGLVAALDAYKHRYHATAGAPVRRSDLYEFIAQCWIMTLRTQQGKESAEDLRRFAAGYVPILRDRSKRARRASE